MSKNNKMAAATANSNHQEMQNSTTEFDYSISAHQDNFKEEQAVTSEQWKELIQTNQQVAEELNLPFAVVAEITAKAYNAAQDGCSNSVCQQIIENEVRKYHDLVQDEASLARQTNAHIEEVAQYIVEYSATHDVSIEEASAIVSGQLLTKG